MTARPHRVDSLELAGVKLDRACQPRVAIDEVLVAEYSEAMRAGDVFPAIVVFFDGADHWLADGFHRYHAARRAEQDFLAAELHTGIRRDAVLYSVGANLAHGARRTNRDKRRAVETLLSDPEWALWTNREIARQCGVVHAFVADVDCTFAGSLRPKVPLDSESSDAPPAVPEVPDPQRRRYVNKHGQEAQMATGRINAGRPRVPSGGEAPEEPQAPTPKRVAIEQALRKDPMATSAAVAQMVGCSRRLVGEVRVELKLAAPAQVKSMSTRMRAERFDQATSTLETSGEWLEEQGVAEFADDPRLGRWLDRLSRAIASLRKVRGELEAAREQFTGTG